MCQVNYNRLDILWWSPCSSPISGYATHGQATSRSTAPPRTPPTCDKCIINFVGVVRKMTESLAEWGWLPAVTGISKYMRNSVAIVVRIYLLLREQLHNGSWIYIYFLRCWHLYAFFLWKHVNEHVFTKSAYGKNAAVLTAILSVELFWLCELDINNSVRQISDVEGGKE